MSHMDIMRRTSKKKTHIFRMDMAVIFVISVLLLMSAFSVYALAYSATQGSTSSDGSVATVIQADSQVQGAADVNVTDAGPVDSGTQSTAASVQTDANLILGKTASLNADRTININLTAYAISQLVTSAKPADIVLVIDQSGSMGNSFGQRYAEVYGIPAASKSGQNGTNYYVNVNGTYLRVYTAKTGNKWYYYVNNGSSNITVTPKTSASDIDPNNVQFYTIQDITNLAAIKEAVNTFVSAVETNAQQNNVDHRIAVVGFANGGTGTGDYSSVGGIYYNTEVLTGTGAPIQYNNLTTSNYSSALQNVNTSAGRTNIASAISMLDAKGATYTNLGLEMAKNIFTNSSSANTGNKNRIVIMFTDGVPGYSGYSTSVANDAILQSKSIKDDGTTVYTVGVFSGADPNITGNNENGFMNYASSNYPNAISVTNPGSRVSSEYNYYLTATSPSALNNIYKNISGIISTNSESYVIRDTVKPQFYISNPLECTVTPSNYQSGVSVVKNADGTYTLDVSDVKLNPVVLDSNGKVASGYEDRVINTVFKILPNDDFIGGNKVLTNKDDSGVYTSDLSQIIGLFEKPTVDLPISFIPKTNDKSIYVGDSIDALSLIKTNENGAPVYDKAGFISAEYKVDGINNAYVDIFYQIKQGETVISNYKLSAGALTPVLLDANGNPVTDSSRAMISPTDNTVYTVTATAIPTNSGTAIASTSTVNANVYVFKPGFSCTDTSIYLSNSTDLSARVTNLNWTCGINGISTPQGTAPTVSYTFVSASTGSQISDSSKYSPQGDFEDINIASVIRTDIGLNLSQGQYNVIPAHPNDTHNFTVYVYKPNITLKDLSVFYGESVDLNTAIIGGINWQCTQVATVAEGTAPNLNISFQTKRGTDIGQNFNAFRPKDYTDVNIDILIQNQNGQMISIKDSCNIVKAVSQLDDHDFTVNLSRGSLTINKTGINIEEGQSFLFTIVYTDFNGKPAIIYEVIQGTDSKTIEGLVAGSYTVIEQTDWSWRYTADNSKQTAVINSSNSSVQVEFKNTYANDKWLSSNNFAINIFKALGDGN